MTEFNKTRWKEYDFVQDYIANRDIYIPERKRLMEITKSFYRHFLQSNQYNNVLDLGCGDGAIIQELLKVDDKIKATLIDGSQHMLSIAKEHLKKFKNISFVKATFQEILREDIVPNGFDFIISSLSIHHLTLDEKKALFECVYSHLNAGGYFLNIDVILAPTEAIEQWYLLLWREWIIDEQTALNKDGNYEAVICRYKDNKDNKPDTLTDQLNALKNIGFRDVDCFYKYGIFTIFGGKK